MRSTCLSFRNCPRRSRFSSAPTACRRRSCSCAYTTQLGRYVTCTSDGRPFLELFSPSAIHLQPGNMLQPDISLNYTFVATPYQYLKHSTA